MEFRAGTLVGWKEPAIIGTDDDDPGGLRLCTGRACNAMVFLSAQVQCIATQDSETNYRTNDWWRIDESIPAYCCKAVEWESTV